MAAGLERNGRTRVQAIFSHAAGDNSTLLSFTENDVITLLVPEARDGWHYGENEKTKMLVLHPPPPPSPFLVRCQKIQISKLNIRTLSGAAGFPSPTPG